MGFVMAADVRLGWLFSCFGTLPMVEPVMLFLIQFYTQTKHILLQDSGSGLFLLQQKLNFSVTISIEYGMCS